MNWFVRGLLFFFCLFSLSFSTLAHAELCQNLDDFRQGVDTNNFVLEDISVSEGDFFLERTIRYEFNRFLGQPMGAPNLTQLDAKLDELKKYYYSRGYFAAKINACLQRSGGSKSGLVLELAVDLGERAIIRTMRFKGVVAISSSEIESTLMAKRTSLITQLLGSLGYGSLQLDEDKARIIELYQSQGFLDVRVKDLQVRAADDLSFIDLQIEVEEGARYVVGTIEPADWAKQISLKPGDAFDLPKLEREVETILIPVKDEGYAFSKAVPELTFKKNVLSVRYRLEKGERVIVRQVIARGLEATHKNVVTREFEQAQGKIYNSSEIEKMRLQLLDARVANEAKTSLENTDIPGLHDLVVTVREAFPIRFNLSPYYLAGEGLLLSAYVMHQNLFGFGVLGLVSAQVSSIRKAFDLVLYDPRVADKNFSWLTEIHHRQLGFTSFTSKSLGGGVRSFWNPEGPFTLGAGLNLDEVTATVDRPLAAFSPFVQIPTLDTRSAVFLAASAQPIKPSWDKNQRLIFDVRLTYSGAWSFSDFEFVELSGGVRWGFSLSPFTLRGTLSAAKLFNTGKSLLPITERYFLGGQKTLRGYAPISIGPYVSSAASSTPIQIGGVSKILQTIEVEYPLMEFLDMKGYVFTDMGNSYAENQRFLLDGLAASVGLGLTATVWNFPLMCELSLPIVSLPGALGFDFYAGLSSVSW